VNARYVIATSTSVDLSGVDDSVLNKASEEGYFTKDKASKKPGEAAFFKQGEAPEVG
jgi:large subunit ribosomal protein L6e